MKILIAAKYTGIGNQVQFIPVIDHLINMGEKVYSDSPVYENIGIQVDLPWHLSKAVKPDMIFVPFGYNWKKFFKVIKEHPNIPKFGYKYRIFGKHFSFGYTEAYEFDEKESELLQNMKHWGGKSIPQYPSYLKNRDFKKGRVVIHNTEKKEKWISQEKLAELVVSLRNRSLDVKIIGEEPEYYKSKYHETPSFQSLVQILKSSEFYIGGDTGIMHMADAFGLTPIVIFGPTCHIKNGPTKGYAVIDDLYCIPCYSWGKINCIQKEKYLCIKNITVNDILKTFDQALYETNRNE